MDFKSDFQGDVLSRWVSHGMIVYFMTPPNTILYHRELPIIVIDQYIASLTCFYDPRWWHYRCIHDTHYVFKRNCDIDRSKTRILKIFTLSKGAINCKVLSIRFWGAILRFTNLQKVAMRNGLTYWAFWQYLVRNWSGFWIIFCKFCIDEISY